MCDTGYTVRDLAADLRDLAAQGTGEAAMLREAAELVKRLALMKHNWLRTYMTTAGESGLTRYVLHEEPDHSNAIFVVTASPGRGGPPHDHGTWAVIAGLEGHEVHQRWKRVGADEAQPEGKADRVDASSIVTLATDAIHSMTNDSAAVAVTLQLYGRNIDFTEHRNYTPRRPS